MHFLPLPESLSIAIRKSFAWARPQAAMLDLDHLRTLIDNGEERALCQEWLHREEQEKLQTMHYEKRHLEWLGGRICAKQAARQYLDNNSSGAVALFNGYIAPPFQIMTAPSGRPFLDHSGLPEGLSRPHISISHSRKYVVAVAASTRCGIDIQAGSASLGRVKDRFCSREEELLLSRHLKNLQLSDHLTLLWAAKEAVKKGAGLERMPGFLELALTHIQPTARDGLVSVASAPSMAPATLGHPSALAPGIAKAEEQPMPETDGLAGCLFTLDYQGRHEEPLSPQLPLFQFQVTICLHQGYGIGLCVLPSQPCPGVNHA